MKVLDWPLGVITLAGNAIPSEYMKLSTIIKKLENFFILEVDMSPVHLNKHILYK